MAEGAELLRSAFDAGVRAESLYVAPEGAAVPGVDELVERALVLGARVYDLAPGVLPKVADTVTPQPVLGVLSMVDVGLESLLSPTLVVVCVDVRDPGNAGTVLRSADAAGASAVVFAGTTVDPYNPKTVRASAGSLFHLPVVVADDVAAALEALGRLGLRRLATAVRDGVDYSAVDWSVPSALVLGNEAAGLPDDVAARVDGTVSIPMAGRAESLNVGVAAAVLCFEALRQRRRGSVITERGAAGSTMPEMIRPRTEGTATPPVSTP
ncbi:MAG TPA: RNA methyltransferase [Acidimicrobiales bacterium]|nr:RNA methyltransferase [Acidimicrobiales bacterium]